MGDPFRLKRFVDAQEGIIEDVLEELARGKKESHWMWFIFPQLAGLGHSRMAQEYAIASRAEAEAYLAHEVLGPRLVECTRLVNVVEGRTSEQIFGAVDTLKFRSSMTLFALVAGKGSVFEQALSKYFGRRGDAITLGRL